MPVPLFSFEHVSVAAPQGWRLRDACGEIGEGATAIVGPSGSGKSTLLRLCNRLVVPAAGVVRFRGDDVAALDPLLLRRRVGMVFQRPTPFAGTCFENLRVAQPEIDARAAAELLERVRLDASFLERDALALSGGEAQRLCLARSLAARPEVLLMDEVTSSVDGETRTALEGLARDCVADRIPVLWVTHDVAQARRVADEIVVVLEGRIADAERAGAYLEERSNAE